VSGLLDVYFNYSENWEHFSLIQEQIAAATAFKVEQFVQEIEHSMKTATKTREVVRDGITPDFKWDLRRLLVTIPSMTEAVAFDISGIQRAEAARLHPAVLAKSNRPSPDALANAKRQRSHFGSVYFTNATGPYMTVAVPIERFAGEVIGIVQATIDLKHIGQMISKTRVGKAGYAYLVTASGQLIAHSDLSSVLQQPNLGNLEQLRIAFRSAPEAPKPIAFSARNIQGNKVFTAFAPIPSLGWVVFAEQPIEEIYAPLYTSMLRTSGVLLAGLCAALMATFLVSRRVARPLETLRAGVERISKGDLSARLDLKTGDEIEIIADEFNAMAAHLNQAYTELEHKVATRTEALILANEKLEEASEHKSRFLANVNHELRTPVSAIIGYGRIVLRETDGQIARLQQENLQDLINNAERLLDLIDTLLDLAKIEAGKTDLRIEPVDIRELIQSATLTIEPFLNNGVVKLIRDLSVGTPCVRTDREKLKHILLNLLSNAVKFTERGEIKIVAAMRDETLDLIVSDTGIGIKKEDFKRVFEEFYRGDPRRAEKYRGTGLGLAIVKRLVGLLGGEIDISSEVGKGSTFTVRLPLDYNQQTAV